MGDIGQHFPDTDPAFKNAKSRDLLTKVIGLVESKNLRLLILTRPLFVNHPGYLNSFLK
jgi:2C-methyl-D-erythritol 2,4-cyclodiphosphate synthase